MIAVRRDSRAFVAIAARLLEDGHCVRFRAEGTSMRPAIQDGDVITVAPADVTAVRAGDIVLYHHRDRPFAHRVAHIHATTTQGALTILAKGDGKSREDAAVAACQILGKVVAIEGRSPWRRWWR